ncbi:E3 ubiquitin-protein ligase TRIM39-like isoform X1 [Cyprinus carpio]|uniref:E3 ubiquitin-protein ligase TRIM39-like n=2 Tax=Cyprinus carpio TaxID=7962 RepID=A0A8C1G463_CYPCA|nr:E3 ubiquitin-protein ligase TRIM39-like isoform X1 [Cyprinus carpio]
MAEFVPTSPSQTRRQHTDKPPSLSSSSGPLAEELQCSVCLDVFTDPVSTPCGHNFCKSCLNQFWDNSQECKCPLCKDTFSKRPNLKINTALRQLVQLFQEKFTLSKTEVLCDICDERKLKALKSCLVCQNSYCETHLEPHQRVPNLKKHKLMDPVENINYYICQKHERPLELFCRDDQTRVCVFCTDGDHKTHNTVPLEEESKKKKAQLVKTQKDVQQIIQERIRKIQDISHSAKLRKKSAEREKIASAELFSVLMRSIERCQAELLEMMEEKQKAAEKQDEELIQELQQEISELKMRDTELDHLLHTEDHLQLLQIDPSLCSPPHTRNWPEISMNTDVSVETLRRALTQLQETLDQKLSQTVLMRMQQFAVDVTLDPDTAHPNLILSNDGKQVIHGDIKQKLPNNQERFDHCTCVLGKDGFSSGRFYFEVQVNKKAKWDLGVARESINRKGNVTVSPQDGFWVLGLWNENEYWVFTDSYVLLSLRVKPQKVGVFVDYEEGLVSFYDVESRSHIYSFTGQSFTEKLYPLFSPCRNEKGTNSAPLIISSFKSNE